MKLARDVKHAAWCAALVFLALAPGAFLGLPGKSVAGAWRVLGGETPYRDFWSMYAPGQFYLVAAVLELTGRQIIVPALLACALHGTSSAFLFTVARRVGASTALAWIVALVIGLSHFELAPELSSYPVAFCLIAWALLQVVRYTQGDGAARLVRAGLALGIAAFFKHDVAGYAALAFALGLAVAHALAAERRPASWIAPWRSTLRILGPAAALVGVFAAWLAVVAGRDALRDLLLFPLGDFRIVRAEPYPGFLPETRQWREWLSDTSKLATARDAADSLAGWILANAPQLAFVAGLVFVARRRMGLAVDKLAVACVLLALLPFHWWAAHTQQNTHMTTMAVASLLLGALAWSEVRGRGARVSMAALGLYFAGGLAIKPLLETYLPLRVWSRSVPLELPGTRGIHISARERDLYRSVYDFVVERVPPGEAIHLGVARHDAIVINNPRFGYLVDRPIATRYHELHPGVTDRDDVQREMIADLERKHVRCAVIWNFGWSEATLQSILERRTKALPECGAKLLDEYFAAHFEPVLERGEYVVLWRREGAAGEHH